MERPARVVPVRLPKPAPTTKKPSPRPKPTPAATPEPRKPRVAAVATPPKRENPLKSVLFMVVLSTVIASAAAVAFTRIR